LYGLAHQENYSFINRKIILKLVISDLKTHFYSRKNTLFISWKYISRLLASDLKLNFAHEKYSQEMISDIDTRVK